MPNWIYRFGAAGAALTVFLGMSYLYGNGNGDLYEAILRGYGVSPFQFPFVDIHGSLAAWECARAGVDVIMSDPCDVLHRGYTYSPLWMTLARIPLGVRETTAVGWSLDLLFLLSLSLLPPPRHPFEWVLVLAATLSTVVVFALERANPDLLIFSLVLTTGLLSRYRLGSRLLGYGFALVAALIKYYPITALIVVLRERASIFAMVAITTAGLLAGFWVQYHTEIARGLPNIASGAYNTDLFAAQNLPFLLGEAAGNAANSPLMARITAVALYAVLAGVCVAICRRLLRFTELRAALAALPDLERLLLVIGSAVIVGCFFAGQSVGYRGVFLLLVIPGLLGISRTSVRGLRVLGLGTALIIVLLLWGECLRLALYDALSLYAVPEFLASQFKIQFWLLRELGWWWVIPVMAAALADFVEGSTVVRSVAVRALDRTG